MAAGESSEDEMRMRRADGQYRWFLVRTAPLRDEQGNLVKWYGVCIDMRTQKGGGSPQIDREEQRHIAAQIGRERARLVEAQEVAKMGSWEAELPSLNVIWQSKHTASLRLIRLVSTHARRVPRIHSSGGTRESDAALVRSLGQALA